jgi:hypothetical protein
MRDARADIGDDPGQLRSSIRTVAAIGEHPHRHVVFPDPIDPAGEMIFGAERGLEESFRYLAVGESLPLGTLTRCDGGIFSQYRRRRDHGVERNGGENDREHPREIGRPARSAHRIDAAAIAPRAQGVIGMPGSRIKLRRSPTCPKEGWWPDSAALRQPRWSDDVRSRQ